MYKNTARPTVRRAVAGTATRSTASWARDNSAPTRRSVLEESLRAGPLKARRMGSSVALAVLWRMRGELQDPGTVARGHDRYNSGLRDRRPLASLRHGPVLRDRASRRRPTRCQAHLAQPGFRSGVSMLVPVPVAVAFLITVPASGSFRGWQLARYLLIAASLAAVPLMVIAWTHQVPAERAGSASHPAEPAAAPSSWPRARTHHVRRSGSCSSSSPT
jgi:hypothetical protein